MTTIGFIRGSVLPVSSKTSSTINPQTQWQSTLNATAEHAEQIEANHPVAFDCADLRLTGRAGSPSGLSADASLDLPGSVAACLWHATSHGSVKLVVLPARVPHPLRSVLGRAAARIKGFEVWGGCFSERCVAQCMILLCAVSQSAGSGATS